MGTNVTYIRDQVKALAKIDTTAMDALVLSCIQLAVYDVAHQARWPELLVTETNPCVDNIYGYALAGQFMAIDRVRYTSGGKTWRLFERGGMIAPPLVAGKPKAYFMGLPQIGVAYYLNLEPASNVVAADSYSVSYYRLPALPLIGQTLESNNWDAEIITRSVQYIYTYMNKLEQAKELVAIRGMTPPSNSPSAQ